MAPIAIPTISHLTIPDPLSLKSLAKVTVSEASPVHTSSLFHHSKPRPVAVSAHGLTFTLEDGSTILDGISGGAAVACLGQGNQEVLGAMMDQASRMAYSYHQTIGCEAGEKLATMLCENGDFEAAAFLNSGESIDGKACEDHTLMWGKVRRLSSPASSS